MLCLTSHTYVLRFNILSAQVWKNAVHSKYLDGALKKLSMQLRTLLTLNSRHLGYAAQMAAEDVVTVVNIATFALNIATTL